MNSGASTQYNMLNNSKKWATDINNVTKRVFFFLRKGKKLKQVADTCYSITTWTMTRAQFKYGAWKFNRYVEVEEAHKPLFPFY